MRLLDQVAQAMQPVRVNHPVLGSLTLPGAERYSKVIRQIGARLVLQPDVTRTCGGLILTQPELLTDCLDLIRVPSNELWVEWGNACLNPEAERLAGGPGQRAGMLVECDASGRAGWLRSFWESEKGAEVSPGKLHFDLDGALDVPFHRVDDTMAPILERTRMELDPEWEEYYRRAAPHQGAMLEARKQLRFSLWKDMLVLVAFSLVAGMRSELTRHPSQLERLNRARRKRRAADLLDFVEVGAGLFAQPVTSDSAVGSPGRSASRLHHVRGHFVRRGDILFWRRPHLRGDARLGAAPARVIRLALSARTASTGRREARP